MSCSAFTLPTGLLINQQPWCGERDRLVPQQTPSSLGGAEPGPTVRLMILEEEEGSLCPGWEPLKEASVTRIPSGEKSPPDLNLRSTESPLPTGPVARAGPLCDLPHDPPGGPLGLRFFMQTPKPQGVRGTRRAL